MTILVIHRTGTLRGSSQNNKQKERRWASERAREREREKERTWEWELVRAVKAKGILMGTQEAGVEIKKIMSYKNLNEWPRVPRIHHRLTVPHCYSSKTNVSDLLVGTVAVNIIPVSGWVLPEKLSGSEHVGEILQLRGDGEISIFYLPPRTMKIVSNQI